MPKAKGPRKQRRPKKKAAARRRAAAKQDAQIPRPVGRPTVFSDETIRLSRIYVDEYKQHEDVVPTIEGLADYLGISYSTLYRWLEDETRQEFWEVVERLRTRQARHLINGGLLKQFGDKTIGMLLSKHGYFQASTVELGNKGGKPFKSERRLVITDDMPAELAAKIYREKVLEGV